MKYLHTKILFYVASVFLIILAIIIFLVGTSLLKVQNTIDNPSISVTGTGEVSSEPNIAEFSFTISEEADTPEDAQTVISEKTAAILEGVRELGVDEDDLETQSYTINPRYDWVRVENTGPQTSPDGTIYYPGDDNERVLVGYEVRQNINVTFRDFTQVPVAVALFAREGVSNLYGPNFTIEDVEALKEQARLEAIAQAKEKAQRLADELDVRLGDIRSFYENEGHYPELYRNYDYSLAARGMSESLEAVPELPRGEQDISVDVTIVYELK